MDLAWGPEGPTQTKKKSMTWTSSAEVPLSGILIVKENKNYHNVTAICSACFFIYIVLQITITCTLSFYFKDHIAGINSI